MIPAWRLSPAFDLVPNIGFNREHVLLIGLDNRPPDIDTLLAEAKYFGIKRRQQAVDVVGEVHGVFILCPLPTFTGAFDLTPFLFRLVRSYKLCLLSAKEKCGHIDINKIMVDLSANLPQ